MTSTLDPKSDTRTGIERRDFTLQVGQQPERARLCSFKEENDTIDRRPVDPPPVVQVLSFGQDPATVFESTDYFIRASIVHPTPAVMEQGYEDYLPVKTATGSDATAGETIQTPERLKGLDGQYAALVIFAKLSVRVPGIFRLKFTLYDTTEEGIVELTSTISEPFEVFSPKLFKGMKESTPLTRHLASQGLKVKLRTDTTVGRQGDSRKRSSQSMSANRQSQPRSAQGSLSPPRVRHPVMSPASHASTSKWTLNHPPPEIDPPSAHGSSYGFPQVPSTMSPAHAAPVYPLAPPPPSGPSLVWYPHYNSRYPDTPPESTPSGMARFGRDDGLPHLLDMASRHDYALATPPASDLSAFSLSSDSRRSDPPPLSTHSSSSRTASGSHSYSPFSQPSAPSSITTANSARSESPAVPIMGATLPPIWGNISLNISGGDDGMPVLPAFMSATAATTPVLPPPLPSFMGGSNRSISPPPILPPLRRPSGDNANKR